MSVEADSIEVGSIADATNLVDVLASRRRRNPNGLAFRFLDFDRDETLTVTYSDLHQRARVVADFLMREFAPGERAMLIFEPGLSFIYAYFGCLMASIVAVPTYPPTGANVEAWRNRIATLSVDCGARCILASALMSNVIEAMGLSSTCGVLVINAEAIPESSAIGAGPPAISPETVAFLQYTSGSTCSPRGVVVSHGNLMANIRAMCSSIQCSDESIFLSWLPQYHDMGLIGGTLLPVYAGGGCTFMSPIAFLQRPYRWLEAMSRYKADVSCVPNFALDLCVSKIKPAERDSLNLEHWRVAINGSEPVNPKTLARFAQYFSPCGFRASVLCPAYGLAESTLAVSISDWRRPPLTKTFDRTPLEQGVVIESPASLDAVALVSCGAPLEGNCVSIVDPETGNECPAGRIGEIRVSGSSVAQAYWNNAPDTEQTFVTSGPSPAVQLRTGDLGFLYEDELYVTGRIKEIIILRGRNIAPYDIEEAGGAAHPALRRGCGVAFSVTEDGTEQIVFLQELVGPSLSDSELDSVIAAIRSAVRAAVGAELNVVGLLEKGTVPKTTSGKLQRKRMRDVYTTGALNFQRLWPGRSSIS